VLEGVLDFVSDELDRGLVTTMNEFEQLLFKLADQARSTDLQKQCMEALREVKRGRADVTPRFLLGLEAALATIKDPPRPDPLADRVGLSHELSLVEDVVLDESATLNEIASRTEIRNSLPLFLLGQRFGVIAGRPAFDVENLPVGPHSFCHILREAVGCLDLPLEYRQQLYRQFDRSVMQLLGPLYEALNTYLIKQRVLPHLTYVPFRAKRGSRGNEPAPAVRQGSVAASDASAARAASAARDGKAAAAPGVPDGLPGTSTTASRAAATHAPVPAVGAGARGSAVRDAAAPAKGADGARDAEPPMPSRAAFRNLDGPRPVTAWPGTNEADAGQSRQDTEMFDVLRQLLAGRRSLLGKLGSAKPAHNSAPAYVASPEEVQSVLGQLQTRAPAPVVVDGKAQPRSVTHLKQDLLAQLRKVAPAGQAPALDEEHGDTIDLVGMLFDHILKDVRPNSPASKLLTKLQVPLLRVALDDKGFFTRKQHPARQMLNTIAESGAYWSSEDDADRAVVEKMNMLVDRVSSEFTGDLTLFDALLGDLSSHMQTQARKAEVAERRHVEAARGKEKLELARLRAAEAIDAKLAGKRVPKFLHTLLAQSWSDVLALSLLRGGEDSETFRHQLHVAERLIESAVARRTTGKALIGPGEVQALKGEIEQALAQVGYHANDSQSISARLLASTVDEEEDDPASRTELAMKLKNRARLGQNVEPGAPGAAATAAAEKRAPLTAPEQACFDQIRHLPFGSWFEFVINQQGEVQRRRLSWYSTMTGHCLFVNHRGQRIAEYTLDFLAREMHRGNLRIVQAEQDSIFDRAMNAIMGALRSFSGRGATPDAPGSAPA
jgi:hypothetical protein